MSGRGDGHGEEHGVPARHRQRVVGALHRRGRDDQRGAGGLGEGAEEVGAHPGDVAHLGQVRWGNLSVRPEKGWEKGEGNVCFLGGGWLGHFGGGIEQ